MLMVHGNNSNNTDSFVIVIIINETTEQWEIYVVIAKKHTRKTEKY